jgi:hypothetical protein
MTRAAVNAAATADALLAWLATQSRAGAISARAKSEGDPDGGPGVPDAHTLDVPATLPATGQDAGVTQPAARWPAPMWLAHTDWLHHRLAIMGTADQLAAFRRAAAGAGIIPWQIDLDRLQEDVFHLLAAPPPPRPRTLSVAGARMLAGQLREAVGRRHVRAVARVGASQACLFDLHELVPVPDKMLRVGPDDPAALAWLWEHWGTTQPLRHVAEDVVAGQDARRPAGPTAEHDAIHVTFWSADWTPWRALESLAERWPGLRFNVRPTYGES